jgi:malate dehydrogenase (quinone)
LDLGENMQLEQKVYEVAIIGGGICGTSLLYTLSNYTNVKSIVLVEKHQEIALVNSCKTSNSQTLHFGDIETNYTLEKAEKVNRSSSLVKNYLLQKDPDREIYSKYHKMVLAVGTEEVAQLKTRYQEFKQLFPELRLIDRDEINEIEPNVLIGRNPAEEIIALFTTEGYTIDFQKLAQSFLQQAIHANSPANQIDPTAKKIDLMMDTKVKQIRRVGDIYHIQTDRDPIMAKVVAITAGAHSLLFAKSLGYGLDYALLTIAGNFYLAPGVLNGKVYTMQIKKIPFAAIHGDPEVHDPTLTRFGPTAKVTLMLERHNYATVLDYFQTAGLSWSAIKSFVRIVSDETIWKYLLRNLSYDLPIIGKRLFLQEARKIVPRLKLADLKLAKGYGGIRPQIINLKTQKLELGEFQISGDHISFNVTPSPGASTCLHNAGAESEKIVSFLGKESKFDRDKFWQDLGLL